MNDRLVEDYRAVITNKLLSNEIIVDVLKNGDSSISNDALMWNCLIPQRYVQYVVTDAESHIMYDVDETVKYARDSANGAYVSVVVNFWIFTHKQAAKYKERLRNDVLSFEIKRTFNGDKSLGIAPTRLLYDRHFDPQIKEYAGRELSFYTADWGEKIRLKNEQ